VNVTRFDDPAAFLETAGPLLLADEARHNLILGVTGTARRSRDLYPDWRAWIVVDNGEPVAAAMLTPPYKLALAAPSSHAALEQLVEGISDDLPGVVGAQPEVEQFVAAWSARRPFTQRVVFAQGIYALEQVRPVPATPGRMRALSPDDRELLIEWIHAFEAEALAQAERDEERAQRIVEHRLTSESAGFAIWEDGKPVSSAGFGGETPHGIRIGPVYTPPELRGRGYATALVAELSASLLAGGRRFCFLYTDLANPTSNAIYERIGYERVCDSAEIAFEPAG
jgi:predicted GNAT family acetyltransferase